MAIKEFVVIHGNVKQDGKHHPAGSFISLDEKEAEAFNAKGETLRLRSIWDAEQAGEQAAKATVAAALSKVPAATHKEKSK